MKLAPSPAGSGGDSALYLGGFALCLGSMTLPGMGIYAFCSCRMLRNAARYGYLRVLLMQNAPSRRLNQKYPSIPPTPSSAGV